MKKKTMMIIGFTLLMSQFMYGDPNMDRLLNEARKRQAAEKAEIDKQERESSKEVSNKVEKQEKVKKEKPQKEAKVVKEKKEDTNQANNKTKAQKAAEKKKYKNMSESQKMDAEVKRIKGEVEKITKNI